MKINDLIKIVDNAYLDGLVGQYWDWPYCRPIPWASAGNIGDTLARFIAVELGETFDPRATDANQLTEAMRTLKMATQELEGVIKALREARKQRHDHQNTVSTPRPL